MKPNKFSLLCFILLCFIILLIGYNKYSIYLETQKYQEHNSQITTKDPTPTSKQITINCIGDNLTLGTTKNSYPSVLSSLTNASINKFGGTKDQTIDLSIRLGKTKIYVKDIKITSDIASIPIKIYDNKGIELDVLKNSGSNFSEVEIAGIAGKLKYDTVKKTHTFMRTQKGTKKSITSLTQITGQLPNYDSNNIAIIFSGTYDPYYQDSIFKTYKYQLEILNQLKTDKYIIVSLTSKRRFPIADDMNKVLKEKYNTHYLDFRSYLLKDGLKGAGITPTEQDKKDIANGYIPSSLLNADKITGNAKFNSLLANQLIKKMQELSYIEKQ